MRCVSLSRDRAAAGLCGGGALVLLASTFLDWYPTGIEGAYFNRSMGRLELQEGFKADAWTNAWQAFSVVDLVLAACMAVGLWAAATVLRGGPRRTAGRVAMAAGAIGLGLVGWRTFEEPFEAIGVGPGAVLAACALLTIAFGGAVAAVAPAD